MTSASDSSGWPLTSRREQEKLENFLLTGNFDDVAGHNVPSAHLLDAIFVRTDNFAHFGLVFFEGFNSGFSIAFLKSNTNEINLTLILKKIQNVQTTFVLKLLKTNQNFKWKKK